MNSEAKIYVAGHRGLVGSAIVRALNRSDYRNLVLRTHVELDLTDRCHQQTAPSGCPRVQSSDATLRPTRSKT
jgi:nucleoside-diphosphate-sugar epimerase